MRLTKAIFSLASATGLGLLALSPGASADTHQVTFTGSTTSATGLASVFSGTAGDTAALSFTGTSFGPQMTDQNGDLDFSLGQITVTDNRGLIPGAFFGTFDVPVTFTAPYNQTVDETGGIAGTVFTTIQLKGLKIVGTTDHEDAAAVFLGGPQLFTYSSPGMSGSFLFSVTGDAFSLSGPSSGNLNLTGHITDATEVTPEPSSIATFAFAGVGMMGLMLRARKGRTGSLAV